MFSINYFFSAGVRGASLLTFMLSFVLIIIMSPKMLYKWWVTLFLLVVAGLLVVEYYYPQMIIVTYASDSAHFVDMAVAYATGDRKSARLNSSHYCATRIPSSA